MRSAAIAQFGSSQYQSYDAQLRGSSIGNAAADQAGAARLARLADEAETSLDVSAPADGTVLTSNPALLLDQDVAAGQPLLELADAGTRTVRVFIPSSALNRIPQGAEVAFALPGQFSVVRIALSAPGGEAVPLPPGLIASQDYKGIKLAVFYCSRMTLPSSSGNPMFGLAGEAQDFRGAAKSCRALSNRNFQFGESARLVKCKRRSLMRPPSVRSRGATSADLFRQLVNRQRNKLHRFSR